MWCRFAAPPHWRRGLRLAGSAFRMVVAGPMDRYGDPTSVNGLIPLELLWNQQPRASRRGPEAARGHEPVAIDAVAGCRRAPGHGPLCRDASQVADRSEGRGGGRGRDPRSYERSLPAAARICSRCTKPPGPAVARSWVAGSGPVRPHVVSAVAAHRAADTADFQVEWHHRPLDTPTPRDQVVGYLLGDSWKVRRRRTVDVILIKGTQRTKC